MTGHRVVAGLTRLLGSAPLVSQRHDAFLFDVRPYLGRLRRRLTPAGLAQVATATLHPLETSCSPTPSELFLARPQNERRARRR